ncbi:hypothetical protein BP00DRAFT_493493 [Aspergillus indologenus CBS 114.80]|uniref:Uncharacterized protein n=1 Tax=Aspergillus indologenus CBS 114.80 TaxID=1450541 RepID=A0A2V5JE26_9EURO|nr:hypothetical protein BP00DRAFT_493493 [Aspergillus indologenus CBS 114.80]
MAKSYDNIPPYTPMKSLGHELGILFGFLVACFVVMGVYVYVWHALERREAHRDKLRHQMLDTRRVDPHFHEQRLHPDYRPMGTSTTITAGSTTVLGGGGSVAGYSGYGSGYGYGGAGTAGTATPTATAATASGSAIGIEKMIEKRAELAGRQAYPHPHPHQQQQQYSGPQGAVGIGVAVTTPTGEEKEKEKGSFRKGSAAFGLGFGKRNLSLRSHPVESGAGAEVKRAGSAGSTASTASTGVSPGSAGGWAGVPGYYGAGKEVGVEMDVMGAKGH